MAGLSLLVLVGMVAFFSAQLWPVHLLFKRAMDRRECMHTDRVGRHRHRVVTGSQAETIERETL